MHQSVQPDGRILCLCLCHGDQAEHAPVAESRSVTTDEDTEIAFTLSGSDVDNDPLTYQVVQGPGHGGLTGAPPGLTYTPHAHFNGTDTFTFKANDGFDDSEPATVTITIVPVNDAPVARAGSDREVYRGDAVVLDGSGSSDVEGDALTYQWAFLSRPGESSAALSNPGAVQPTFAADVSGVFELSLTVNDGSVDSEPDIVKITARPFMVTVPDLSGMSREAAETELADAGLSNGRHQLRIQRCGTRRPCHRPGSGSRGFR